MPEIYQIDAFTDQLFGGNPAAVVPLTEWPATKLLQSIATENNLAETAFIVSVDGQWEIRWFTPSAEVALCGHATLAAAHVAFTHLKHDESSISFNTRESGVLKVSCIENNRLSMSFPAIAVSPIKTIDDVTAALGQAPTSLWKGHYSETQFDYMAVFDTASDVASLCPDNTRFAILGSRGVIATAPGDNCDFVSRYFAPAFGIPEDPVTGSAHCLLTPFWAEELKLNVLNARQISTRGGSLECHNLSERVELIGQAVEYMKGTIFC